jgi:hypothetical protein
MYVTILKVWLIWRLFFTALALLNGEERTASSSMTSKLKQVKDGKN